QSFVTDRDRYFVLAQPVARRWRVWVLAFPFFFVSFKNHADRVAFATSVAWARLPQTRKETSELFGLLEIEFPFFIKLTKAFRQIALTQWFLVREQSRDPFLGSLQLQSVVRQLDLWLIRRKRTNQGWFSA